MSQNTPDKAKPRSGYCGGVISRQRMITLELGGRTKGKEA